MAFREKRSMLLPHINHNSGVKIDHFFLKKAASLFGKDFHAQLLFQIPSSSIHISRFHGTRDHGAFVQPRSRLDLPGRGQRLRKDHRTQTRLRDAQPDSGSVDSSGTAVFCAQRTDHPPALLTEFQNDWCGETIQLRDSLGIGDSWAERWSTLSHGERKRLQLAVALWSRPSLLAVDEPFNHLDSMGRDAVVMALSAFTGCGLLVSHDRAAMETLCTWTLLFHPGRISLYNAGYSRAVEEEERERTRLAAARVTAKREYIRKKRDARKKMLKARTIQAHSGGAGVSFRDICRMGLDGPSRVDGIVQKAGQRSREAAAKAERARERMESITYRKVHRTGIDLTGEPAGMNLLLDEAPGSITVGRGSLVFPALEIRPGDRIALTGPNGSGKSTLLRWMKTRLRCPEEKLVWIGDRGRRSLPPSY